MGSWQDDAEPVEVAPTGHWTEDAEPVETPTARKAKAEPSAVSRWESFKRGGIQGATFGFSDEGAGATQAGLAAAAKLFPGLFSHFGIDTRYLNELPTGEVYRAGRNADRAANAEAQRAHGGFYLGGNLLGGLATAALGGGAGSLGKLVATGAGLGALQGLGASDADLTAGQYWQAAKDTSLGGLVGSLLPLGIAGAGKLANPLRNAAISTGRRVLTSAGLAGAGKKALANEAVQQALEEGAIRLGGTTKGAFKRLGDLARAGGNELGAVEDELVRTGVPNMSAEALASPLEAKAAERARVLDEARARVFGGTAEDLRGLVTPKASVGNGVVLGREELQNLSGDEVRQMLGAPGTEATKNVRGPVQPADGLPLKQVIGIKRTMQEGAGKAYESLNPSVVKDAQMEVAGDLRKAILNHVEKNAGVAPEAAAKYGPLNERLSNLIAARNAAEVEVNNAAKRHFFSPLDWMAAASAFGGKTAMGDPGGGITLGALAALGGHLARTRGPSTTAATLYALSKGLRAAEPALSGEAGIPLGRLLGRQLSLRAPYAASRLGGVGLSELLAGGADGSM